MCILLSDLPIAVSSEIRSGSFELSNQDTYGTSMYTIRYSYPATVNIGTNLTIQILVVVDQLTGLKTYVQDYGAVVTLNIDATHTPTKTVHIHPGSDFLYQGAHWGPVNVSLPLNELNTGVGVGQEYGANLTIAFADYVWLTSPVLNYAPESGSKAVGTVTIQNQSPSTDLGLYLPYLAVAVGIALVLISILIGKKKAN